MDPSPVHKYFATMPAFCSHPPVRLLNEPEQRMRPQVASDFGASSTGRYRGARTHARPQYPKASERW